MSAAVEREPIVARALEQARSITGPILPRHLLRAIPPIGQRRSHLDTVALIVLTEIMGAYRFTAGRQPYWSGPAYSVNRDHLAYIACCPAEDVSRVLTHLQRHGFIRRWLQTRRRGDAMVGKRTLVVPDFERILGALAKAESHANFDVALKAENRGLEGHLSPNGLLRPERDGAPGVSADRVADGSEARGVSRRRGVERVGGADSPTQEAMTDRGTSAAAFGVDGQHAHDTPTPTNMPTATPEPVLGLPGLAGAPSAYDPAEHAKMFADLFIGSADRTGAAVGTTVSATQLKRLTTYFSRVRLTGTFVASIAAYALHAAAEDPDTYEFTASITEPLQFVYGLARVQKEFGQFDESQTYVWFRLLHCFTPLELEAIGVPHRIGVLEKLSNETKRSLWMHHPDAPAYYRRRSLPVPDDFLGELKVRGGVRDPRKN